MGIVDNAWVRLTCPTCGVQEVSEARDLGNTFGGWDWTPYGPFKLFEVSESGGGKKEPTVTSATCKKCKVATSIEEANGMGRPKGW